MKVYIASRYSRKNEMREHAKRLRESGIEVTSRWLEEKYAPGTTLDELTDEFCTETARTDFADIDKANAILFFSENPLLGTPRGGRHVEFGYALAASKLVHVIGPRENIFHYLPGVKHYDNVDQFLEGIAA